MGDFENCVKGHEERFRKWISDVQPLLNENKIAEAWKSYPWIQCGPPPFCAVKKDISQSRVGLLTTCGVYLEGQEPFQISWEGDFSYREIPVDFPREKARFKHGGYNPKNAKEDLNVVFPIEVFRELEKERKFGSLNPTAYGFMGMITNPSKLRKSIEEVVDKMVADRVEVSFLFFC
jgi:D-proline reductase (dithiol) PrdB